MILSQQRSQLHNQAFFCKQTGFADAISDCSRIKRRTHPMRNILKSIGIKLPPLWSTDCCIHSHCVFFQVLGANLLAVSTTLLFKLLSLTNFCTITGSDDDRAVMEWLQLRFVLPPTFDADVFNNASPLTLMSLFCNKLRKLQSTLKLIVALEKTIVLSGLFYVLPFAYNVCQASVCYERHPCLNTSLAQTGSVICKHVFFQNEIFATDKRWYVELVEA